MYARTIRSVNDLFALPHLVQKMLDDTEAPRAATPDLVPPVDVLETDSEVKLVLEVAGLDRASLNVTLENGVLSVSGEKQQRLQPQERDHFHGERRFGKFARTFKVPTRIDAGRIEARYTDGVVEIVMPKTPEAQPRRIEIK